MGFNKTLKREFKGTTIDYGIIDGNSTIVFIKAGLNGSMLGYQNKYLTIANNINQTFGYTVIVASNPSTPYNAVEDAMELIKEYASEHKFKDVQIYHMGFSNGAYMGASYGYLYPEIKRMLLINPPLMWNYHQIKEGCNKFKGEKMVFVIGEHDQSKPFLSILDLIDNPSKEVIIYPKATHQFVGMLKEFIELPIKYLC